MSLRGTLRCVGSFDTAHSRSAHDVAHAIDLAHDAAHRHSDIAIFAIADALSDAPSDDSTDRTLNAATFSESVDVSDVRSFGASDSDPE